MHRLLGEVRSVVLVVLLAALGISSTASAQIDPFASPEAPEEVSSALLDYSGTPFVVSGDASGITPGVDMLSMMYQCQQPFGQIREGVLYIHGFDYVDTNVYRLSGPRALGGAQQAAMMRAQAAAVQFLEGLSIWSKDRLESSRTTGVAGTATGAGPDAELESVAGVSTLQQLSSITETEVSGYVRGGRAVGIKVLGLGENGFCVVLRYAVPVDQDNFDPAGTGPTDGGGVPDGADDGYEVPAPGQEGDF